VTLILYEEEGNIAMSESPASDADYVIGHALGEEQRLRKGGQLMYAATKHLFQQAGIKPGMKVLDVGCGAGDVSLLVAELVGPAGSIVGVDSYAPVLNAAQANIHSAGLRNVDFVAGDIREITLDTDFDAVVGRNVLMYAADLTTMLRACVGCLRPGGIVAFQEVEWTLTEKIFGSDYVPRRARQVMNWMTEGYRRAGAQMQMSAKFPGAFLEAGLPFPEMQIDGLVGRAEDQICYEFAARGLRDMLPKFREYGILTDDIDFEAFVAQMQEEIIQQRSFVPIYFMVGAWSRKP
jgi:2-polyprenyl-3-methyl-5-hydroxy-6-metoxy-1,4-benzoquinol methylase